MKARSEATIQVAIVIAIRRRCPGVFVAHWPNGGTRHIKEAINLKRQGVVAGMPDLLIIGPSGTIGFLEVKTAIGALQPAQAMFRTMCEERGVLWALVRSVDEALATLAEWGADVRSKARVAA